MWNPFKPKSKPCTTQRLAERIMRAILSDDPDLAIKYCGLMIVHLMSEVKPKEIKNDPSTE